MILRYIISIVFTSLMVNAMQAQAQIVKYPQIGRACPDFVLRGLKNYPAKDVANKDLDGQYFILYFWSNQCSACAASFPNTELLRKAYINTVKIFLIGDEDKAQRMKPIYEKLKDNLDLKIPHTFDSVLFKKFVYSSVPHLIWVDREGVVQAVTNAAELNLKNMSDFVTGSRFTFYDRSQAAEGNRYKEMDRSLASTKPTEHGILYKSILTQYDPADVFRPFYENVYRGIASEKAIQGCTSLDRLYKLAYTGYEYWMETDSVYTKYYPAISYEVRDTSDFSSDISTGKGFYCYSLSVPGDKTNSTFMRQRMRMDLENYFGYHGSLVVRDMPYWKLEVTESGRKSLRSKTNDQSSDRVEPAEVKLTNVPMSVLVSNLFYKHIQDKPPIIDKTNIHGNVDFEIEGNLYDMQNLKKLLRKKGLILTLDKMPMKVLVIADKANGI